MSSGAAFRAPLTSLGYFSPGSAYDTLSMRIFLHSTGSVVVFALELSDIPLHAFGEVDCPGVERLEWQRSVIWNIFVILAADHEIIEMEGISRHGVLYQEMHGTQVGLERNRNLPLDVKPDSFGIDPDFRYLAGQLLAFTFIERICPISSPAKPPRFRPADTVACTVVQARIPAGWPAIAWMNFK